MIAIAIGVLSTIGGSGSDIPTPAHDVVRIDLLASRDLGTLPNRSAWCAGAAHCWTFQDGAVTDLGDSPGGWNLSTSGSPRSNVATGLPVMDATGWVDYTSEDAAWFGAADKYFYTDTLDATDQLSVTMVVSDLVQTTTEFIGRHYQSPKGYTVYTVGGLLYLRIYGASSSVITTVGVATGGWRCITIAINSRTSSSTQAWINGTQVVTNFDTSATGVFNTVSSPAYIGGYGTNGFGGGLARYRLDYRTLTAAEHDTLCGSFGRAPAGGATDTKPLLADDSWTQTSDSAPCHAWSSTQAICAGGAYPTHAVDATGLAWEVVPSTTQRIPFNVAVDCTNWTCSTATVAATTAPDGSSTAADITMGGGNISATATGYGVSAPLQFRMWTKCSSGTLDASNVGGAGHWTVDCSVIGGAWTLLHPTHAAVAPEAQAWQATAGGVVALRLSGADASVWAPTAYEGGTALDRFVIPTPTATAVATGDPVWAIDNDPAVYYGAGDTVTQLLTQRSGTCLAVSGGNLLMSGASTCSGSWYGLTVTR